MDNDEKSQLPNYVIRFTVREIILVILLFAITMFSIGAAVGMRFASKGIYINHYHGELTEYVPGELQEYPSVTGRDFKPNLPPEEPKSHKSKQ